VASIHSGFKQPQEKITERLLSALENPHVDIIAHPTGRLISSRPPYQVNLEEVFARAAETGTALEINAYHDRLDLNDIHCRRAAEMGAKLCIGTDAHHTDQLWMMRLGVAVARRGWLEKVNLLNTWSLPRFRRFLSSR
jgi:DNA polymerase (family 10)